MKSAQDVERSAVKMMTVLRICLVLFLKTSQKEKAQKEMLSTPTYSICKERKSGTLVSPDDVTVIAAVEDKDKEPAFQSPLHASVQVSAHVQPDTGT